jgi:hypothetical protein
MWLHVAIIDCTLAGKFGSIWARGNDVGTIGLPVWSSIVRSKYVVSSDIQSAQSFYCLAIQAFSTYLQLAFIVLA